MRKQVGMAYLLWIAGGFGVLGLHHLYLGRPWKSILWMGTVGLFGLGALYDLFILGQQVERYNAQHCPSLYATSYFLYR